ncbi:MAG: fumarate hydratase, partial [Mycobacteriaceae bacterium]|nr:fumarate hydratase [Mycobacteriaceae bacterium]
MTVTIKGDDLVRSVADAFQFISYYHPADYIRPLAAAYQRGENPAAKDAIRQILINSRMAALGRRPICQDTGTACVFLKVGMDVRIDADRDVEALVNAGVAEAYNNVENPLRASIVRDPLFTRVNTRDNAPAVVFVELVRGDTIEVACAAKGGGSENKARFKAMEPSDSVVDWVLETLPTLGA